MGKSGIALGIAIGLWAFPSFAGFEMLNNAPAPVSVQQRNFVPNGILTPEPSMPALAMPTVEASPLAPPQTDRVLSNRVSRSTKAGLAINPNPLSRRIVAPPSQPFDAEALLDATILGEPIALAPEGNKKAAPRELTINPHPIQNGTAFHSDAYDVARLEQGMMEGSKSLRPVLVPGGRTVARQSDYSVVEQAYEPAPIPPRKPDIAVAALQSAAPAKTENYSAAVGFGRDLPLALALSQLIPDGYNYSFGQNVDMGTTVSWEGGKPWNEVLQDMLAKTGLRADINGGEVRIKSTNT